MVKDKKRTVRYVRIEMKTSLVTSQEFRETIRKGDFDRIFLEVTLAKDLLVAAYVCQLIRLELKENGLKKKEAMIASIAALPAQEQQRALHCLSEKQVEVTFSTFEEYVAENS